MWVDAVIFVFSLEDEISFQTVYHYYSRMANYRNTSEIPLVLVGTQGECQPHTGVFGGLVDMITARRNLEMTWNEFGMSWKCPGHNLSFFLPCTSAV